MPAKKFVEMFLPPLACEITIEEASGVPLPKKEEYDWSKISNREIRAVLIDNRSHELLSNVFIISANWKAESPGKWLLNATDTHAFSKSIVMKTDLSGKAAATRDINLLFELVLFTTQHGSQQQVCCSWGSIPIS